jgi:uncharacterized protein YbjQ (UPF0145 family)
MMIEIGIAPSLAIACQWALSVWPTIVVGAYPSGGDISAGSVAGTMAEDVNPTVSSGLPMSTTFELPGFEVTDNLGVVYGLVVRSIGLVGGVAAGFKALKRGEVGQQTRLLEDSRRHALDRLVENARLIEADALVGVRFDSSEVGNGLTEILAYGTAVKLRARS